MPRLMIIAAIAASYFIFAILLNSVGTVILQSIDTFGVSKPEASTLEGFKDLSIAGVSFLVASFIPRVGYKVALLAGLAIVGVLCISVPSISTFWAIKVLFAGVGTAFALVKVSVYALIGQVTSSVRQHSSLMNTIEGIFMLGVLSGYWVFSAFIDPNNPANSDWMNVYYLLAVIIVSVFVIVALAPIKPTEPVIQDGSAPSEFVAMLRLAYKPLVLIFIFSVFLYVLIEQGIGTWLPTFNKEVLGLPSAMSVQLTSIFAVSLALGRLGAGAILARMHWYPFLNICLVGMGVLILVVLPMAEHVGSAVPSSLGDAPLAAFVLPLIGLLMAPLYPALNSVMLSALPKNKHAPMTGLIVVFSALGGTTGSIITGLVFDGMGGQRAFYLLLVPVTIMLITLYFYFRMSQNMTEESASEAKEFANE